MEFLWFQLPIPVGGMHPHSDARHPTHHLDKYATNRIVRIVSSMVPPWKEPLRVQKNALVQVQRGIVQCWVFPHAIQTRVLSIQRRWPSIHLHLGLESSSLNLQQGTISPVHQHVLHHKYAYMRSCST